MKPSAVVFVGLGSLTECADIDRQAWNASFRALGLRWDWSWDSYAELMRHGGDRTLACRYANFVGHDIDAQKLDETQQRSFAARLSRELALRPGIAEILRWAVQRSVGLALVSRRDPGAVYPLLAATARARGGIEFDTIVTRRDGQRPAPFPDAIEFALSQLGAKEGVVVTDMPAGAAAGLDAGAKTIAYPGILAEEWNFPSGVIGPVTPDPSLIEEMLGAPTRTAAE